MKRVISGIACAVVVTLGIGLTAAAAAPSAPRPVARDAAPAAAQITFAPKQIPYSAPELANRMRGQYAWNGNAAVPPSLASGDVYYRDHFAWGRLEPKPGQYNWQFFEDGLKRAGASKGKFGFRVVSWCPGCWTRPDFSWTPAWIPKQAGTNIPDWNSPKYVAAYERLMKAIGDRYRDDPRLGWMDIGGYGPYGEWHNGGTGRTISAANAARLMNAALRNFPKQHVLINAMQPSYTNQALALSPRIGLRTDCLGGYNTGSLLATAAKGSAIAERWKTQPVLSEWCSFGTPAQGLQQVRKYHISQVSSANIRMTYKSMTRATQDTWTQTSKQAGYRYSIRSVTVPKTIRNGVSFQPRVVMRNVGSAPTYDAWSVRLQLRDETGRVVSKRDVGMSLKSLKSGLRTAKPTLTFRGIRPGTYTVSLKVVDPTYYGKPMKLASEGRASNGSYILGKVSVA